MTTIPVVRGWTLRPWTDEDESAFDELACDSQISEFLGEIEGGPPAGGAPSCSVDGFFYMHCAVISARSPKVPVGLVMASGGAVDPDISVDIAIGSKWRRLGAGRAALSVVNQIVADLCPGVPVTGKVRRDNVPMQAMLAKAGVPVREDPDDDEYTIVGAT